MTELTTPVKNIENGKTLIGKSDDKEKSEEKKINTGSSPNAILQILSLNTIMIFSILIKNEIKIENLNLTLK